MIAIGGALAIVATWHQLNHHLPAVVAASAPLGIALRLLESTIMIGPPIGLVYAGTRLADRDLSRTAEWTVVEWMLIGIVTVVGVISAVKLHQVVFDLPITRSIIEMEPRTIAGLLIPAALISSVYKTPEEAKDRLLRRRDVVKPDREISDRYAAQRESYFERWRDVANLYGHE
ncbi:MAG: hypothetical protein R3324_11650 [Halobacteriales archaeon]|nr:hypothetical protein [Halobacteriales archaeon]